MEESPARLTVYLGAQAAAVEVVAWLAAGGAPSAGLGDVRREAGLPPLREVRVAAREQAAARRALAALLEEAPGLVPRFGAVDPGLDYQLRPSAYALLRDAAGRVAIARQPLGDFLVGGGVEAGETAPEAIRREGVEEVGLRLAVGEYLGTADEFLVSPKQRIPLQKRCAFYRAEKVGEAAAVEEDHELVWVDPAEALRGLYHLTHRWAVLLDGQGRVARG